MIRRTPADELVVHGLFALTIICCCFVLLAVAAGLIGLLEWIL